MFEDLFDNEHHLHLTNISILGMICQGIYQYYITKELNFSYFLLYIFLTFITSLLFYKIFRKSE